MFGNSKRNHRGNLDFRVWQLSLFALQRATSLSSFDIVLSPQRRETWCPGGFLSKAPLVLPSGQAAAVRNRLQCLSSASSHGSSMSGEFSEAHKDHFLAELEEDEELLNSEEPAGDCELSPLLARSVR